MPIDPRLPLQGRQPEFSLDPFFAARESEQRHQTGLLGLQEAMRQRDEEQRIRAAYAANYGSQVPGAQAEAAPGLAGMAPPEAPFPPLAQQEAAATQQALYGVPPQQQPMGPAAIDTGGAAGAPQQGLGAMGNQIPSLPQVGPGQETREQEFLRQLYRISPQAGRLEEQHQYDTQALQWKQHHARLDYLAQVTRGILEDDSQQAYDLGKQMLLQSGMPPQDMPAVYDRALIQRYNRLATSGAERLQQAQIELAQAKAQREGAQAPDYGYGDELNAAIYARHGQQIAPGQRPTPGMVAEARQALLQEDPTRRLTTAKAAREEDELEAQYRVRALDEEDPSRARRPGAPGASGGIGTGAPQARQAPEGKPASYRTLEPQTRDRIDTAVASAAAENGLDPSEIYGIMGAESNFDPRAVSRKGARGLMQLMPRTAKELGVDAGNLEDNIRGGARYYAQLKEQYGGNVDLARAAYNAGPEAVKRYGGVPPFKETQAYGGQVQRMQERFAGGAQPPADAPAPGARDQGPADARLKDLEARRDRQEAHIERLKPYATSEAGKDKLAQGERELTRLNSEIARLSEEAYERGPESLARKKEIAAAGIEAALDKPLSSEDAALYGQPQGTTGRELRERATGTPAPLKGEAAKTYHLANRMALGHGTVSQLEAHGVTGTPFLTQLEQAADKITGAVGTVVGLATGGVPGAAAGGAGGFGVGGLAPGLLNLARTPSERLYLTAQLAFIAGILRKESGAAITAEEYRQYSRIYFPSVNDDAGVVTYKRGLRQYELDTLQEQFPNRPFRQAPALPAPSPAPPQQAPQEPEEPGGQAPPPVVAPQAQGFGPRGLQRPSQLLGR